MISWWYRGAAVWRGLLRYTWSCSPICGKCGESEKNQSWMCATRILRRAHQDGNVYEVVEEGYVGR